MEKESDDEQMYAQIEFPQKKCSRVTDWQREGPWGGGQKLFGQC